MKKIITHPAQPIRQIKWTSLPEILETDEVEIFKCLEKIPLLYQNVRILKKDGKPRDIKAPRKILKKIQRKILDFIFSKIPISSCSYGFSSKRSIIENVEYHKNGKYLLVLDIKNFFPNVHYKKIHQIYLDLGFDATASLDLTKLTTLNYALPQGAPTSPFLASLALTNLDHRLTKLSKSAGIHYSRYFDDMCFSGSIKVKRIESLITKIIAEEGYRCKRSKRKLFEDNAEKEVTGIMIRNGSLYLKNTPELISYLNSIKEKGLQAVENGDFEKERLSLMGKISFLKRVDKSLAKKAEDIFNSIKW